MAHFGLQVQFHITVFTLDQMLKESFGTLHTRLFQECMFKCRDFTVTPQHQSTGGRYVKPLV